MSGPDSPSPQRSDAPLRALASDAMSRYAHGEVGALTELYRLLAPKLQRYFLRSTHSRPATEDLLQQTFMNVHGARETFRDGADAVAWVFAIAHRLLIDDARRIKTRPPSAERSPDAAAAQDEDAPEVEETPESVASSRELARRLDEELAKLPPANRLAFELVRFDGMTVAEAAEALSITPNAVKLRAHRVDEALRDLLEREKDR